MRKHDNKINVIVYNIAMPNVFLSLQPKMHLIRYMNYDHYFNDK